VNKYSHITKAFIDIISHKWSRIQVAGHDHKWSFVRDGEEKGLVSCIADKTAGLENVKVDLEVGLKDLLGEFVNLLLTSEIRAVVCFTWGRSWAVGLMIVLKTSGSAFENFYQDENTTLQRESFP
jgi:urate oxidase